jgi:hypothetical protein
MIGSAIAHVPLKEFVDPKIRLVKKDLTIRRSIQDSVSCDIARPASSPVRRASYCKSLELQEDEASS